MLWCLYLYARMQKYSVNKDKFSWDVISMYPSIDNEVGLGACKAALDRRDKLSPSTDCLLEVIKITLECNNSTFNKHYRQNRGTAMGPHNACSYADLAMTTIDHKILDTNTRPNDITFPPDWSRRLFQPLICRCTSFARIYGMA